MDSFSIAFGLFLFGNWHSQEENEHLYIRTFYGVSRTYESSTYLSMIISKLPAVRVRVQRDMRAALLQPAGATNAPVFQCRIFIAVWPMSPLHFDALYLDRAYSRQACLTCSRSEWINLFA